MVKKSKLILWDIDGTLIHGARQAAQAFHVALRSVYELDTEIKRISYAGKTDPQIVRETLLLHDLDHDHITSRLPQFQTAYLHEIGLLAAQLRADVQVLPGVRETLAALAPATVHSLLTGNFITSARLKLDAAELSHWFDWDCGAFGSDHEHRNSLVPIALARANNAGYAFAPADVVVIGDTPNDIACARAGGVRVIAVATGSFDRAALGEADVVLADLCDVEAVKRAFG